jgi:hypothetical protein
MQFNDMVLCYLMTYHTDLLTEVERRTLNHLVSEIKIGRNVIGHVGHVGGEKGRILALYFRHISDDPVVLRLAAKDITPFACGLGSEFSSNTRIKLSLTVVHDAQKLREPRPPGNVVSAVTIGTATSRPLRSKTCRG